LINLCFITGNQHKYLEVKSIASEYGLNIEMCTAPKIEVQADSIEEVVLKSAILAYFFTGKPVLVEDAGLFIEALNGFPGPYSSYVYKTIGIQGILKLLEGVENRRACFKSAVAVVLENTIITSTGEVCGEISREPRGNQGFGFDPIFIPSGETRTFGEMSIQEKNRYSHRAKAVRSVFEEIVFKTNIKP